MKRRITAMWMILAMLVGMFGNTNISKAAEQENAYTYQGTNFLVTFQVDEQWESGYKASVIVKNTGLKSIKNWKICFELEQNIESIWNAEIQTKQENFYTIKNVGWNQNIQPNSSISFSFIVKGGFTKIPEEYRLLSSKKLVDEPNYTVEYCVSDCWESGFNGSVKIENKSEKTIYSWGVDFEYPYEITNIWNAEILIYEQGVYQINSMEYNQNILPAQCVTFGFTCSEKNSGINPQNIQLYQYEMEESSADSEEVVKPPVQNTESSTGSGIVVKEDESDPVSKGGIGQEEEKITDSEKKEDENKDSQEENVGQDGEDNPKEEDRKDSEESQQVSEEEISIEISEETALDYVYIEYMPGNAEKSVTQNVILVNDAPEQMEVIWHSSDETVVGLDGTVHRQNKDENVVLTAEIHLGQEVILKTFELTVIAQKQWRISDIEDLTIYQIKDMNKDNENYNCKVNDFGYLKRIFGKYSPVKVDSFESALYSLYSVKTAMGITNPLEELRPYDIDITDSRYIFKFHQVYQGLEVFSNTVTVSSGLDGTVRSLSSSYYPFQQEIEITPYYSYEQAVELLRQQYGEITVEESEEEEELCIINYYGHVDLVWNVLAESESSSSALGNEQYQVMVGARDGEIKYKNPVSMSIGGKNIETEGTDMLGKRRTFNIKEHSGIISKRFELEDIVRRIRV